MPHAFAAVVIVGLALGFLSLDTEEIRLTTLRRGSYDEHGRFLSRSGPNPSFSMGRNSEPKIVTSFFVFNLRTVEARITSATVTWVVGGYQSPDASETITLFDVNATTIANIQAARDSLDAFADLGTGTIYGAVTIPRSNFGGYKSVTLNPDGLAALNAARGGLVGIGLALTTLNQTGPEYVWGEQFSITTLDLVTDNEPAEPGRTTVRANDVIDLRERIGALREQYELRPYEWVDEVLSPRVTPVRATHITQLRQAIDEVYRAAGLMVSPYTNAELVPGVTIIKAAHIEELRSRVAALE
jgi:hypothetical protein